MKERGIAFLAGLWRLLAGFWTLVIVSALAGVLGNIIFTLATTGTVTFANLHNLTSWLSTNLVWAIIVLLVILALTICAYIAHRHELQETAQSTSAWNVPYLRNPFFTGREELLKQLHDNLTQNKAAALTQAQSRPTDSAQAQAIHGLGGIGKT